MSTLNICFHGEIRKTLCGYPYLYVAMLNNIQVGRVVKYQIIIIKHYYFVSFQYCKFCYLCSGLCNTICQPGRFLLEWSWEGLPYLFRILEQSWTNDINLVETDLKVGVWSGRVLYSVCSFKTYSIYRIFSDRQAWANSVDPDEKLQNAASHQGLHCLPLIQPFLDTASGSKLYGFKFKSQYGKELRCLNTKVIYGKFHSQMDWFKFKDKYI